MFNSERNQDQAKIYLILSWAVIAAAVIIFMVFLTPAFDRYFYLSAGFTILAFLAVLFSARHILTRSSAEAYFYDRLPLRVSIIYVIVQIIAGFVIDHFLRVWKPALLVQVLIAAAGCSLILYTMFGMQRAKELNDRAVSENQERRQLSEKVHSLISDAPDYTWKRKLIRLYDDVSMADPGQPFNESTANLLLEKLKESMEHQDPDRFDSALREIRSLVSKTS